MVKRMTAALFVLLVASAAWADDDRGASVGASVSATNMESRTELSFAGTFGFRFTRLVSLEIESTIVPSLRSSFGDGPLIQSWAATTASTMSPGSTSVLQVYPGPVLSNAGGRLIVLSNNIRIDMPITTTRATPYFVAGGGIANLRRTATFTYPVPLLLPPAGLPGPVPVPVPQYRNVSQPVLSSLTELALTIGGGVDIHVASHVSVGVDLRLIRLLGEQDQNVGRFGVGARYTF